MRHQLQLHIVNHHHQDLCNNFPHASSYISLIKGLTIKYTANQHYQHGIYQTLNIHKTMKWQKNET